MTYKVVRSAAGEVIAFGPNRDSYEPVLKAGETLSLEAVQPELAPVVSPRVQDLAALDVQLAALPAGSIADVLLAMRRLLR